MNIEIERKFLVKNEDWKKEATGKVLEIIQAYLQVSPDQSIRVRMMGPGFNDRALLMKDIESKAFITIKRRMGDGINKEFEYEIPREDAVELLCDAELVVSKQRHYVISKGLIWEVDVFEEENEGLIVAELELPNGNFVDGFPDLMTAKLDLPEWAGEEVTKDPKYLNMNLAMHPFKTWKEPRILDVPPSVDSLSLHKK